MGPDAKPKPKVQKQIVASPGLRSMLYGLSMKLEREEKMQRKQQKKTKGKFYLKQVLRKTLCYPTMHTSARLIIYATKAKSGQY
jgi:hypothetical protein